MILLFYFLSCPVDARSRILLSNQEQLRAKNALQLIFLRIQSTSSKRACAYSEIDSSGSEAASVSDLDAYLNSLHSIAAAEALAMASAKSDLTACAEVLVDVERLGRLKLPNVWDIISKYLLIVQPVSRISSCLACTQVFVERMISHLKLVLHENRVRMGNELTDAIVYVTYANTSFSRSTQCKRNMT